ncbi:MAG: spondin domain-containing protein [Thiolinea sp.]
MKKHLLASSLMLTLTSPALLAAEFTVSVQNLTHGIHFTPLLVAAHDHATQLFNPGTTASSALQAMAEGGDISGLSNAVHNAGGQSVDNPAGGLLGPGKSVTTTTIDNANTHNKYLSVVAMMLPTNDGFIGLNSYKIPETPGTYTVNLNAYDAGTEANNELINGGGAPGVPGIPAAPGNDGGSNGTGVAGTDTNTHVHIHRGVLGDTDANGGKSDLDSRIHRWLNPVARVTITVK